MDEINNILLNWIETKRKHDNLLKRRDYFISNQERLLGLKDKITDAVNDRLVEIEEAITKDIEFMQKNIELQYEMQNTFAKDKSFLIEDVYQLGLLESFLKEMKEDKFPRSHNKGKAKTLSKKDLDKLLDGD